MALEFACNEFRENIDIVKIAIKGNLDVLELLSDEMFFNR